MKTFSTVLVFVFIRLSDKWVESLGFTALNDSYHATMLHIIVSNEDDPSDRDPAHSDPNVRKRICEDIVNSEFLRMPSAKPVDFEKMYNDLTDRNYADIFNLIYNSVDREYTNPYRLLEFSGLDTDYFREHAFVCLWRFWSFAKIVPFFVSKEYNVAELNRPYKRGRFVFASENFETNLGSPIWYEYLALAEEPAIVFAETEFNVELYFLNIRKYVPPASSNVFDPLCKLVSDDGQDPQNQHYRFCVAISRSSDFKNTIRYPSWSLSHCQFRQVSFRTARGIELAAGKTYYERMTPCYSQFTTLHQRRREESRIFISRAYKSDRILVYQLDSESGNIYLKNLSSNVSIVDELNSLDFVEE